MLKSTAFAQGEILKHAAALADVGRLSPHLNQNRQQSNNPFYTVHHALLHSSRTANRKRTAGITKALSAGEGAYIANGY